MAGALNMARRAAASRATPPVSVLITGETGTGKELLARAIHNESPRKHGPFIAINCSGIPETLLESELFGYKQGAFTGAVRDKRGMFGAAEGGTLFLDEIGDMPMASQAKLLRVLQEHEYTPLGSTQPQRTNVRIITATHRDLEKAIAKSKFRSDLYYRLSAVPIHLPPLRERPEDTLRLAEELCERYNAEEGRKSAGFQESARKAMAEYSWPGNVRELQNVVQRAVIMTDEGQPIGLEYVRVENMRELQNIIQRSGMATEEGRQRPILVPEHAKIASPQDKDDLPVLAGAENKSGDIISLNSNKIIAAEEAGMGADAEPVSSAPPPPANPPVISDAPAPPVPVAASSPTELYRLSSIRQSRRLPLPKHHHPPPWTLCRRLPISPFRFLLPQYHLCLRNLCLLSPMTSRPFCPLPRWMRRQKHQA
ncbi:MAG: sigma 54-interacting transcriptional regulator [Alphaproteobacteria bacterium]